MSRMLGQSSSTISKHIKINNDVEQIFNFLNNYYDFAEGIMINKIENTDYYMYGFNKEIKFSETNIPMYIQVVDESNIKLYDMIKEMGGKLVFKTNHADRQLHFRRRLDDRVVTTECFLGHPDALASIPDYLPVLQYVALKSWVSNTPSPFELCLLTRTRKGSIW
jgi:hypothetical protein